MPDRIQWTWIVRVMTVTEVKERTDFKKGATEKDPPTYTETTVGWSVRYSESSAIMLPEKPDFKAGDKIKMTMTKVV